MRKILLLGWKDLILAFRDRAGIILMLLAPFVLTLGMGLVTGAFSGGGGSAISGIEVALVNQDQGQLGGELVKLFQSADLAELVIPEISSDPAAARARVDADEIAAAVIIPPGFTAGVIPDPASGQTGPAAQIELYSNPNSPTSAGVIKTIAQAFIDQVEMGRIGAQVTLRGLLDSGRIAPQQAAQLGAQIGAQSAQSKQIISLQGQEQGSAAPKFNVLAYLAPGMALMFLMFTTSNGGRSLLVEKTQGTLPRLLVAPLGIGQVLLGKMFGIFLTGVAQMLILINASELLFRLDWGDPLALLALVLAAVIGAVGWGIFIAALVKTPGQASSIGSAIMLSFGILGGSFFDASQMPAWFRALGRITPNAWGIDGFTVLAQGGGLTEILPNIGALLLMGAILYAIALFLFNRRGVFQR